jgi:hypothetical protein
MYNVFKRPMFKRGGSTQGTGIMSHVEPRKNFQTGTELLDVRSLSPSQRGGIGFNRAVDYLRNLNYSRALTPFRYLAGFGESALRSGAYNLGRGIGYLQSLPVSGALSSPAAGVVATAGIPATVAGTMLYANKPKTQAELDFAREFGPLDETMSADELTEYYKERERLSKQGPEIGFFDMFKANKAPIDKYEVSGEAAKVLPGETAMDAIIRQGTEKASKEVDDPTQKPTKYEETDLRTRVQKEADTILNLFKDEKLDRAEAALLAADALKQGGSLSDKINYAVKQSKNIVKRKADEERAAKALAYKAVKEEDIAKIKAGELPGVARIAKDLADLQARDPKTLTKQEVYLKKIYEEQLKKDSLEQRAGLSFAAQYYDPKEELRLKTKINEALKKKSLSEDEQLQLTKDRELYEKQLLAKRLLGFKQGGRVQYAEGTQPTTQIEATETTGESNVFPTKSVEKLSFAQLRERLPQEITNDIVQLIANSEEALQDFAYIRTQQDINDFNVKYGVNLILPPANA